MAGKNAQDDDNDPVALDDGAIDGAVGDLRGVLKKDAGNEPAGNNESVDSMGGAAAFGSDFGADIADDEPSTAVADPFDLGATSDFDASAELGGAPNLDAPEFGGDFDAAPDLGAGGLGSGFGSDAGLGQDFGATAAPATSAKLGASGTQSRVDLVLGIPIDVQIILGSSRMAVSSLMDLSEGATIALDRKIGEPVEIMVNGKLIGRGEITVLESDETRFAVRIIEVVGATQKKSD
ncbi:flagellar motor switch protein FliN [Hoeflea sp. G2-23]|uniref:Flagellar motor switch protein FliN n=1 Tax=Hoeflea algicola TaxID=2983763 RepID=A0ABT3ZE41_9HYPH|nr:flagellar motor switch protein FliN [Hoeflea algicola]MCY0149913.1 flagellar motor switch protein FliN [Hoeflea algicola]